MGHIRLETAKTLDKPAVKALIAEAVANASQPFMPAGPDRMIIKCISANQRPRRPQASPNEASIGTAIDE